VCGPEVLPVLRAGALLLRDAAVVADELPVTAGPLVVEHPATSSAVASKALASPGRPCVVVTAPLHRSAGRRCPPSVITVESERFGATLSAGP